jgi:hypothetical protein
MTVGYLFLCFITLVILIIIKGEISYRLQIKKYKALYYKEPEKEADRSYCMLIAFFQASIFVLAMLFLYLLITNWNTPIC